MSADIYQLFPEGLNHAKAEQGMPQHDQPLRCMPPKASEKEGGKDTKLKTSTVVLDQVTTQKVYPYEFDVIETFSKMQKHYSYFLEQQDVRKKWRKYDRLEDNVPVKIQSIPDGTTNTKELSTLKKLNAP